MAHGANLTGVRVAVYGRHVWPKALCQLVEVVDHRPFLDEGMTSRDFSGTSVGGREVPGGCDGRAGHPVESLWRVGSSCQSCLGGAGVVPHAREVRDGTRVQCGGRGVQGEPCQCVFTWM